MRVEYGAHRIEIEPEMSDRRRRWRHGAGRAPSAQCGRAGDRIGADDQSRRLRVRCTIPPRGVVSNRERSRRRQRLRPCPGRRRTARSAPRSDSEPQEAKVTVEVVRRLARPSRRQPLSGGWFQARPELQQRWSLRPSYDASVRLPRSEPGTHLAPGGLVEPHASPEAAGSAVGRQLDAANAHQPRRPPSQARVGALASSTSSIVRDPARLPCFVSTHRPANERNEAARPGSKRPWSRRRGQWGCVARETLRPREACAVADRGLADQALVRKSARAGVEGRSEDPEVRVDTPSTSIVQGASDLLRVANTDDRNETAVGSPHHPRTAVSVQSFSRVDTARVEQRIPDRRKTPSQPLETAKRDIDVGGGQHGRGPRPRLRFGSGRRGDDPHSRQYTDPRASLHVTHCADLRRGAATTRAL